MPNGTPHAQATIKIKTFRKVATTTEPTRYCAVDVEMPATHSIVTFHAPNPKHKHGKFVFSKQASLDVRLETANGTDAVFVPVAIAFRRSWSCVLHQDCDPTGSKIFNVTRRVEPPSTPGGKSTTILTIENTFSHDGPVAYEFYILVQREEDAALGLIDPDIENE